jgi:uncharacterized protein
MTKPRRLLALMASAIMAAYGAAVSFLYLNQTEFLYRANPIYTSPAEVGLSDVQELTLATLDGAKIKAWYSPARPSRATILFCHGKGGNMASRAKRWTYYVERGYGVMFFDYHGFGGSEGVPTEEHLKSDARAAYDWLRDKQIAPKDIALIGESLGSGVCTMLATQVLVSSLELEAGYSSIADIAAERHWWAPVRLLIKDAFDAVPEIAKIRAPLLMQHGDADQTIPVHFAKTLFAAAPAPKEFRILPGHGHALGPDGWQNGLEFVEAVRTLTWKGIE